MRITHRIMLAAATLSLAVLPGIHAQAAHPNFSGVWVMDRARSDTGQLTPTSMTLTIQQSGNSLTVDREILNSGVNTKSRMVWGTDGNVWKNKATMGGQSIDVSSVLTWAGPRLTIRSSAKTAAGDAVQTDLWALGPDGKSLMVHRSANLPGTQMAANLVLVKKG